MKAIFPFLVAVSHQSMQAASDVHFNTGDEVSSTQELHPDLVVSSPLNRNKTAA